MNASRLNVKPATPFLFAIYPVSLHLRCQKYSKQEIALTKGDLSKRENSHMRLTLRLELDTIGSFPATTTLRTWRKAPQPKDLTAQSYPLSLRRSNLGLRTCRLEMVVGPERRCGGEHGAHGSLALTFGPAVTYKSLVVSGLSANTDTDNAQQKRSR